MLDSSSQIILRYIAYPKSCWRVYGSEIDTQNTLKYTPQHPIICRPTFVGQIGRTSNLQPRTSFLLSVTHEWLQEQPVLKLLVGERGLYLENERCCELICGVDTKQNTLRCSLKFGQATTMNRVVLECYTISGAEAMVIQRHPTLRMFLLVTSYEFLLSHEYVRPNPWSLKSSLLSYELFVANERNHRGFFENSYPTPNIAISTSFGGIS